ncbi:VOC family protein [Mesorhizobium sp.]|uniref:VOC family protein n=1 Tax=Mesorhizobium sp. TaxID=1871066 RepID=UPI00257E6A32|nr:VOC family protein [Mesorhizobium sp.]
MAIDFNHTILPARDSEASAKFLAEMLGLPAARRWGPFQMVTTENGANLDYMDTDGEIRPQHYAFLVSEAEFDEIFAEIRERNLPYWADPAGRSWARSTTTTAAAAFISRTRTVIFSRSLPVSTAAADGTCDRSVV